MFACTNCRNNIGPKISPIRTTAASRLITYTRQMPDEDGILQEVRTVGHEIVRENILCHKCAGVEAPKALPELAQGPYLALAHGMHKHARACSKALLQDCKLCNSNITTFASFPAETLSVALVTHQKPDKFSVSLAARCVDALMRRAGHSSQRSKRDFEAGYQVLKRYEEAGGRL